MQKNTRNLLITIISFIVVFAIVAVAYNALKSNAPAVSFTPTFAAEEPEPKSSVAPEPKSADTPEPSAPAPAPANDTASTSDDAAVTQGPDTVQEESAKAQPEAAKGPMIPNLPLTRLDGTKTTLNEVRDGKPAVINYFASWCPPCKQELPHFQKAFDEYGDEISFIFLDALDGQRETLKTINAFIKNFPFTGPVFYDSGEFAQTFQTTSLPTTVFIDKEGRLVTGYLGFVPEDVLYADIATLLD